MASRPTWPFQILQQNFGMCISPNDLILPICSTPSSNYYRPWKLAPSEALEDYGSTIVEDKDKIQIFLDVQYFKPDELKVKVTNKEIVVEGNHNEREDDSGYVSRQFTRKYFLPSECNTENVTSTLSSDGILIINAVKNIIVEDQEERHVIIQRDDAQCVYANCNKLEAEMEKSNESKSAYATKDSLLSNILTISNLGKIETIAEETNQASISEKAKATSDKYGIASGLEEFVKGTSISEKFIASEKFGSNFGIKEVLEGATSSRTSESLSVTEKYDMKTTLQEDIKESSACQKSDIVSGKHEFSSTEETDLYESVKETTESQNSVAILGNYEKSGLQVDTKQSTCQKFENASAKSNKQSDIQEIGLRESTKETSASQISQTGSGKYEFSTVEETETTSKNADSTASTSSEVKDETYNKSRMQIMLRDEHTALIPKEIFERNIDGALTSLAAGSISMNISSVGTRSSEESFSSTIMSTKELNSKTFEKIEESLESFQSKKLKDEQSFEETAESSASSVIIDKNKTIEMSDYEMAESQKIMSSLSSMISSAAAAMSSECQLLSDIITAELEEAAENQ